MTPRPKPRLAPSRVLVVLLLLLLSLADCAPVGWTHENKRDDDQLDLAPYSIGDLISPFALVDARGRTVDRPSLLRRTSVLLFGAPGSVSQELLVASIRRVAEVEDRLRPEFLIDFQILVLMLDSKPTSVARAQAMLPDAHSRWTIVVGPEPMLLDLAAAFGVVTWSNGTENLEHTLRTVVVNGEARIADLFVGLDDWTPSDLLAAVSAASQ